MECTNECMSWPCPDLSCLPCLPGLTVEFFEAQLEIANELFFEETQSQFTGCECYAVLRPCIKCTCVSLCSCDPCRVEKIDLCGAEGLFSVQEITGLNIDGDDCASIEGWDIVGGRYLCCPEKGWPAQNMSAQLGDKCTWSITVRYGKPVPKYLLFLRDCWLWQQLSACLSKSGDKCDMSNVESVSYKGLSYRLGSDADPLDIAKRKYKAKKCVGYFPDKSVYQVTSSVIQVVEKYGGQACDVEALLKDWVEEETQPEPGSSLVGFR